MISVTMDQIIAFRNSGDIFEGVKLPLKIAYKLNKIRKSVEENWEFYAEKFQEILDKYSKKYENGNMVFSEEGDQIMISDGMVDECNEALTNLQNLEVEINNYNLTIDDLGEDMQCTPDELEALMPFMN